MDYSLHLYEDAVNATLHLTPMDGGAERYFTLTTTIADYPPVLYTHTDHLGTPKALTDQNQQIVWQADYNPFGMANITTGQVTNNLRFSGQYFDAETGFHYNWNRYYNFRNGRYITSDPIGLVGGLSTYAYVENNPINLIDPEGLQAITLPFPGELILPKPWPMSPVDPIVIPLDPDVAIPYTRFPDPNSQECRDLLQKIKNTQQQIAKREQEVADNRDLPERIGPGEKLRETVRGHRKLIRKLESNLRKLEKKYQEKCGLIPYC